MYDMVIRYLARVFVTDTGRSPSAENFAAFASAIGRCDFLPLPFEEIGPGGVQPRIGLRAADGTRLVFMRGESIDFEYHQPRDPSQHRSSFNEFCVEAADVLARALEHVATPAHRIAAVQEGLLAAMSDEAMHAVACKLIATPPGLPAASPFEWDWRVAFKVERQFGSGPEPTNTLAAVKRLSGRFSDGQAFDRIQLAVDVNTPPERTQPRFESAGVRAFLGGSAAWHDEVAGNVLAFCGLRNGT